MSLIAFRLSSSFSSFISSSLSRDKSLVGSSLVTVRCCVGDASVLQKAGKYLRNLAGLRLFLAKQVNMAPKVDGCQGVITASRYLAPEHSLTC